jgi:hypothetical protein
MSFAKSILNTHVLPLRRMYLKKYVANKGFCPQCGYDLDTGFECLKCNFDAIGLIDGAKNARN